MLQEVTQPMPVAHQETVEVDVVTSEPVPNNVTIGETTDHGWHPLQNLSLHVLTEAWQDHTDHHP